MRINNAFTLAEVLITLGIIGVVAAMTIPTLIANTNGAKYRSQFKKTVSTLNQAGLMAQAQYGFDFAGTASKCSWTTAASEHPDAIMSFCSLLNGTLTGQSYLGVITDVVRNNNGETATYYVNLPAAGGVVPLDYKNYLVYMLADGSIVAFHSDAVACELPIGTPLSKDWIDNHEQCRGFIDVNGPTLPNKEVTCTDGDNATSDVQHPCAVKNDANHLTDIFPIVFHDSTVEPASDAARYVLSTSK